MYTLYSFITFNYKYAFCVFVPVNFFSSEVLILTSFISMVYTCKTYILW